MKFSSLVLGVVSVVICSCAYDSVESPKSSAVSKKEEPAKKEESKTEAPPESEAKTLTAQDIPVVEPSMKEKIASAAFDNSEPAKSEAVIPPKSRGLDLQLLQAAKNQKVEGVRLFLLALANSRSIFYEVDGNGQSLGHWLARQDKVNLVKALIDAGAVEPFIKPDNDGRIALHYAPSAEMAEALWNVANSNSFPDSSGMIPVTLMAKDGRLSALGYAVGELCRRGPMRLIDFTYGNLLNSKDNKGLRAIDYAVLSGNLEVYKTLMACASVTSFNSGKQKQ
jgi:ankyrin repeat protein